MRENWRVKRRSALVGAVLLGGALVGSCGPAANAELERFLAQHGALSAAERETALRAKIAEGGRLAMLAHYALGNDFYLAAEQGEGSLTLLDSARVHFEAAAALDTTFVEAWVNLGSTWDDLSDRTESGQLRLRQERWDKAERAYGRALALKPTDEKAQCNLGALLVKRRQYPEALAHFKKALADNPKSALAHYNIAIMFADSKMYREAKREWEAAAKCDPKGDIGQRSRENVKVVEKLMAASVPAESGPRAAGGH